MDLKMDTRNIKKIQRTNTKMPRRFAISPNKDHFVYTKSGGKLTVELKKSPSSSSGCSSSSFISQGSFSGGTLAQNESDSEMVVKEEVNEDGRINIKFIPNNNLISPKKKTTVLSKVDDLNKQRITYENKTNKTDGFLKYTSPDGKIVILKNPNKEKKPEVKTIKKVTTSTSNNQPEENQTHFPVVYVKTEPIDGNEDYIEKSDYIPINSREEPLATPEDIIKNVSFVLNQFNTSEVTNEEYSSSREKGKEMTGLSAPEDIIKNVSMVLNQFQDDLDLEEYAKSRRNVEIMDLDDEIEEEKSSDASTQTESYGGMGELIELINNQILGFQYKVFGREYKLDQCSLFFTQKIASSSQSQTNRLNIAEVKVGKHLLESKNVAILKGMSISENFYKKRCSEGSNDGLEGLSIKVGPSFEEIKKNGSNDKEKCSLEEIIQLKTGESDSSKNSGVKETVKCFKNKNEIVIGAESKGKFGKSVETGGYLVPLDESLDIQRSLNSSMNKIGVKDLDKKSPQEITQKERPSISLISPPKKIIKTVKNLNDINQFPSKKNEIVIKRQFNFPVKQTKDANTETIVDNRKNKAITEKPFPIHRPNNKRKIPEENVEFDELSEIPIHPTIDLIEDDCEVTTITENPSKKKTKLEEIQVGKTKILLPFEPTSSPRKLLVYSKKNAGNNQDPLMLDTKLLTQKQNSIVIGEDVKKLVKTLPKKFLPNLKTGGKILKKKLLQQRPFKNLTTKSRREDEDTMLKKDVIDNEKFKLSNSINKMQQQQVNIVNKRSKKVPLRFKDNNTLSHVFLDKLFKKQFGMVVKNSRNKKIINNNRLNKKIKIKESKDNEEDKKKLLSKQSDDEDEDYELDEDEYDENSSEEEGKIGRKSAEMSTGEKTYGRRRNNEERKRRCEFCKKTDVGENHSWNCYPKSVCTICRNLKLGKHDFGMGHLKRHERNGCFCKKCGTIFPRRHLRKHTEKCALPENGKIPFKDMFYVYSDTEIICKLCKSSPFDSFKNFARHVHACHKDRTRNYTTENEIVKKYRKIFDKKIKYKCRNCGNVSWNLRDKISHHAKCINVLCKETLEKLVF